MIKIQHVNPVRRPEQMTPQHINMRLWGGEVDATTHCGSGKGRIRHSFPGLCPTTGKIRSFKYLFILLLATEYDYPLIVENSGRQGRSGSSFRVTWCGKGETRRCPSHFPKRLSNPSSSLDHRHGLQPPFCAGHRGTPISYLLLDYWGKILAEVIWQLGVPTYQRGFV